MKLSLINYVTFQIGWFSCVLSAANGQPMLGLLVTIALVLLHLKLAQRPMPEIRLLLACGAIGIVFDSLLLATGWISYPSGSWIPGLAPYWIIAIWLLFATTLNLSMGFLRGRHWLAALAGALGGPLSYMAGEKLGGIGLNNPEAAMIALAVGWGIIMPLISAMAVRWNGFEPRPVPDFVPAGWREEAVKSHV